MNTTNKNKDNSASVEIIDRNIVSQNNIIDECYIIVGDSRTIEMNNYYNIDKNKNYYVIASNKGDYDYLINSAMPKIEEIAQKKKEYNINVIMCLGINDLARLDKYIDTYKNISSKYNLTIVSVNPIGYANGITNATIEMFNTNIKNMSGVQYIDTYSHLMTNGFTTVDGIHYTKETYGDILNIINQYK